MADQLNQINTSLARQEDKLDQTKPVNVIQNRLLSLTALFSYTSVLDFKWTMAFDGPITVKIMVCLTGILF